MEVCIIEKLDANNYATWCNDVRVLLMEKNCWRIVSKEEVTPVDDDPEKATKVIKDFMMRKDRAYSTIYLNITNEYRSLITDTQDPSTAWKRLEKHFQPDSRARVIGLTDDFFSCRISSDEEIGLYAARLKKIGCELEKGKSPVPEWYKAFQLIRFLPHEFDSIVQSIYRWKDEEFTFDKILQELLAEESRLKQCQKDQSAIAYHLNNKSAHQTHPGTSTSNVSEDTRLSTRRPRQRCRRTPARGQQKQRTLSRKRRTQPVTSFIITAMSTEMDSDLQHSTEWVFDSAASAHFCCNKDLMSDYKSLDNLSMNVAIGGVSCPVEGKGSVHLEFRKNGKAAIK